MISVYRVLADDLKRLSPWLLLVFAVAMVFILFWDVPLAWYFETELDPSIHRFMGRVTEAANSAIWFGLAIVGLLCSVLFARVSQDPDRIMRFQLQARAWTFMMLSMVTAAALLNFLKLAIGRYRPRYLFNDDLSGFEPFGVALKMASLPSGHAQSIWSAMIALAFLTPRYTPVYIAVAITVSVSRFVTAVHFVSDVIVGSFLSIAVAVLMRRWFERKNQSVRLTAP
ncbi:MAG: phosphatase PAP2 family protein [Alphaproteobacteria bacterium]|nr:phosphatase PAP2 family protein [Alphaproteobacteria bacterium]